MSQYQEKATVTRVEQFTEEHYRITALSPDIALSAKPGQFVMVQTGETKDPLLRRPFSIHQTTAEGHVQFYFKVVGRGTDIFSRVKVGEQVSLFGPLGNGFSLQEGATSIMVGGGLGIAPLLFLAKESYRIKKDGTEDVILLGAQTKNEIEPLLDDFQQFEASVITATDDGSLGRHGFVTEVLQSIELPTNSIVYSCGPEPMMESVGKFCKKRDIQCQVSVESVMACGMGACLGCSRASSKGGYTHVCLHGPVYKPEDLVWNI